MPKEFVKIMLELKQMIRGVKADNSVYTEARGAVTEQELTDMEITQIEDEQVLTDHDIAIMELQAAQEVES